MPSRRRSGGTKTPRAASLTTLVADADAAAGVLLEARDHAQRRGLAAAGRAEQRDELALADPQVDVVDRDEIAEPPARPSQERHLDMARLPSSGHSRHRSGSLDDTCSCTQRKTITSTIIISPMTLTCSALPFAHSFSSTTDSTSEPTE